MHCIVIGIMTQQTWCVSFNTTTKSLFSSITCNITYLSRHQMRNKQWLPVVSEYSGCGRLCHGVTRLDTYMCHTFRMTLCHNAWSTSGEQTHIIMTRVFWIVWFIKHCSCFAPVYRMPLKKTRCFNRLSSLKECCKASGDVFTSVVFHANWKCL